MQWIASPNHDDRRLPVSMIVLHYTGMPDADGAIARLADPEAKVSAHYVVLEDGSVVQMVEEERRAWHAGKSRWRGIDDVNSASIGIEIVNPGHEFGYVPFPEAQMDAVVRLTREIVDTYGISPRNVVGHSDVAPARKQDPGELFDWDRLARHRLAVPGPVRRLIDPGWADGAFLLALERYGYDVSDGRAATTAFQRRFRRNRVDGIIDGQCRAILMTLLLENEA